jgi:hypothetical protein
MHSSLPLMPGTGCLLLRLAGPLLLCVWLSTGELSFTSDVERICNV